MRAKKEMEWTSNPQVYKKTAKKVWEKKYQMCGRCPYHGGENAAMSRKVRRSWKHWRKTEFKKMLVA
jgi:hypothetical protein